MTMVAELRAPPVAMVGLIASLSLAAAVPTPAAEAGAVPDSIRMSAIRRASGNGLLVYTATSQQEIRHPLLDSTGVWSANWESASRQRTALIETQDAPHPAVPKPISWSQIETVKTAGHHEVKGLVAGAAIGLVVGTAVFLSSSEEALGGAGIFVGSAAFGGLVGMFVGSVSGKETLYRSRENN
jgi:hypothetical protein